MTRLALAFIVLPSLASAHSWYDAMCCNTNDCAPVAATTFRPVEGGWLVTLHPGDHPLVTRPISRLVPYSEARESQDDGFHACVYPRHTIRCVYVPPMGW